mmetsp:Transcript_50413/g.101430  ORF Transcript_50413/g.101430 Transcript_50413/m.101430 type:complete len:279 (+) Transcript_50413:747-1583(+)
MANLIVKGLYLATERSPDALILLAFSTASSQIIRSRVSLSNPFFASTSWAALSTSMIASFTVSCSSPGFRSMPCFFTCSFAKRRVFCCCCAFLSLPMAPSSRYAFSGSFATEVWVCYLLGAEVELFASPVLFNFWFNFWFNMREMSPHPQHRLSSLSKPRPASPTARATPQHKVERMMWLCTGDSAAAVSAATATAGKGGEGGDKDKSGVGGGSGGGSGGRDNKGDDKEDDGGGGGGTVVFNASTASMSAAISEASRSLFSSNDDSGDDENNPPPPPP